jgi:hypothetical protein
MKETDFMKKQTSQSGKYKFKFKVLYFLQTVTAKT